MSGRIVVELLINAIKYAHPTGLPVFIHLTLQDVADDRIAVEVEDDGVGLPENFNPATDGGLGFRIMTSLATQLQGQLEFKQMRTGLRARLTLPREGAPREGTPRRSNVVAFPTVAGA